jgi:hypothetical protein
MSIDSTEISTPLRLDELSRADEFLQSTRDNLLQAVTGLDTQQWHFKPAPDCWSIAENLEHLVLIEYAVQGILGGMPHSPAAEPDRMTSQIDEMIINSVPKRSRMITAPEALQPASRWSPEETLLKFLAARTRTLELLHAGSALRGHVRPHPLLGTWDGYQWILAVVGHSARHTTQIEEVKASEGFPVSAS